MSSMAMMKEKKVIPPFFKANLQKRIWKLEILEVNFEKPKITFLLRTQSLEKMCDNQLQKKSIKAYWKLDFSISKDFLMKIFDYEDIYLISSYFSLMQRFYIHTSLQNYRQHGFQFNSIKISLFQWGKGRRIKKSCV